MPGATCHLSDSFIISLGQSVEASYQQGLPRLFFHSLETIYFQPVFLSQSAFTHTFIFQPFYLVTTR